MATVHPTACVDDRATLAADVVVGPWCVIQGEVRIAAGSRLISHVCIEGPVALGRNCTIFPFATIGFAAQDRRHLIDPRSPGVRLGDDNIVREGVTIHRATAGSPTTLGDRNYLMANSHVAHDCVLGSDITMANGSLLGGHVSVGDKAFLGGNSAVHQFCRVGRLAMISGSAMISKDLPPFCTLYENKRVGSLNLVGLRRAGFRDHIKPLMRAYEIFFSEDHTNVRSVELIQSEVGDDPLCAEFAQFIASSRRGLCKAGESSDAAAVEAAES
jgi:UDP-N-acetylglucosamine acyltransferase